MRNEYTQELKELNSMMTDIGTQCQVIITLCTRTLDENDESLFEQIYSIDSKIDRAKTDIESFCMRLLLRQQPVAGDLRRITAALEMVSDMERISDQAADIAELSPYVTGTAEKGSSKKNDKHIKSINSVYKRVSILDMAKQAVEMVGSSVKAFVDMDQHLAEDVIASDDKVDQAFTKVQEELIDTLSDNKLDAKRALDLHLVAKYFERISDHAVNISEWVIYAVTGERINSEHNHSYTER